ncbi:hypothetical protein COU37_02265, partial [Candidatus Micrarchaeota archaeon CG10_big_fil_rev_8_21_14_0_10_45_29]
LISPAEAALTLIYGQNAKALEGVMEGLKLAYVKDAGAYDNFNFLLNSVAADIRHYQEEWGGFASQYTKTAAFLGTITQVGTETALFVAQDAQQVEKEFETRGIEFLAEEAAKIITFENGAATLTDINGRKYLLEKEAGGISVYATFDGEGNSASISVSRQLYSRLFEQETVAHDRRAAIDAFGVIAFMQQSQENKQFSLIGDEELHNYAVEMKNLPAGTAAIIAQNSQIMTGLSLEALKPGSSLGLFRQGINDIIKIYATLNNEARVGAIAGYASEWGKLSSQGNLLSHLKAESVDTQNEQIQILDPRLSLFRTYGRMDNTYSIRDIFARFNLGRQFIDETSLFRKYGNTLPDRTVASASNWNVREHDEFFYTMPKGWSSKANWDVPPLHLRLDYGAYLSQLGGVRDRILREHTPKGVKFRSIDAGTQAKWGPATMEADAGARLYGSKLGEQLMMGASYRGKETIVDDVGTTQNLAEGAARVAGSNLLSQEAGLWNGFVDWYSRVQEDYKDANVGGADIPLTLTKVNEDLFGNVSSYLYGSDIIIGGWHHYRQNEGLQGDEVKTDVASRGAPNRDEIEIYIRRNNGWYKVDFKQRDYESFRKSLADGERTVDSDGLLQHSFVEAYQRLGGTLEEANVAWERYIETEMGEDKKYNMNGHYVGLKFDFGLAGLNAQSLENERVTTLGMLFGDPKNMQNATVAYAGMFNLKQYVEDRGRSETYRNYRDRRNRAYRFGEQEQRDNFFNEEMVLGNVVLQGINQYRVQAFGGVGKSDKELAKEDLATAGVSAYGKTSEQGALGFGAYYTYKNDEPVEAFVGAGAKGEFIGLPATATGYYYNREYNDESLGEYGWMASADLGKGVTLFSNAYVNMDNIRTGFSDKRLEAIKTDVAGLKKDIDANWDVFSDEKKRNSQITLGRAWANRLFNLDYRVQNYLMTDATWARPAEFSLGVKTEEGLYKTTYMRSNMGDELSMLISPANNLAFFASKLGADDWYAGGKIISGSRDFAVAGTYGRLEGNRLATVQTMFKDKFGISIMGGDDYWRVSALVGTRPFNILVDIRDKSGLFGYGATARYFAPMGLDFALGLNRNELRGTGFSTIGIKGEIEVPVGPTSNLGIGYYNTHISKSGDNWGYLRLNFSARW